jgi:hypothetical protein
VTVRPPKPAQHDATCPWCGTHHEYASHVTIQPQDYKQPKRGDVSLCAECGALAVYDRNLILRRPNKIEKWQIDRNPLIALAIKAWINAKGQQRQ